MIEKTREALALTEDALSKLELSEQSLTSIALMASRIARLLEDHELQQIMICEAGGYKGGPDGVGQQEWSLLRKAGRIYSKKDKDGSIKELAKLESLEAIETELQAQNERIKVAVDPDISVSSANPRQHVIAGLGNASERQNTIVQIRNLSRLYGQRRSFIHEYLTNTYYELKYSIAAEDSFSRIRSIVDANLTDLVPEAIRKFSSVHENLESNNSEDWSNAVHSCRRILQAVADELFPARDDATKVIDGVEKTVNLGKDAYINRLIAFVEERTSSKRFHEIVGSHLKYLGQRLDAIFRAAQKGSHAEIVKRDEADRYVVYTYMLVGDILSLARTPSGEQSSEVGVRETSKTDES